MRDVYACSSLVCGSAASKLTRKRAVLNFLPNGQPNPDRRAGLAGYKKRSRYHPWPTYALL